MSANGRLSNDELAPIPGGLLRKDAAAAWNAMCVEARQRGLAVPMPDGPDSSYRPYDRQVYWKSYWCGRGACQNAAEPGTSRHGEGIAVDCAEDATHHAATIDAIGEKYGWSKKWSDAPWEPWHNTFKSGIWTPPKVTDQNGYTKFSTTSIAYKGAMISESNTVIEYDRLRANAHENHVLLDDLRVILELLRKRVWIAAHPNWISHRSTIPTEWSKFNRGWRYQQLSHRAQGKRLHVDFKP